MWKTTRLTTELARFLSYTSSVKEEILHVMSVTPINFQPKTQTAPPQTVKIHPLPENAIALKATHYTKTHIEIVNKKFWQKFRVNSVISFEFLAKIHTITLNLGPKKRPN